jgi:hypothetical protein
MTLRSPRSNVRRKRLARRPGLGLTRCLALLFGAVLIAALLLGCGDKKTTIAGGELRKIGGSHPLEGSIEAGESSLAEARDGTVLLEWSDQNGDYETYALPGKGWSRTSKLLSADPQQGPRGVTAGFDGRGERLAVWLDDNDRLAFDVRRPGDDKVLLRTSLSLGDDYDLGAIEIVGSSSCGFLVGVDANNGDAVDHYNLFFVRCSPRWSVSRVGTRDGVYYYPAFDRNGRPGVFGRIRPPHGLMEAPAWERLVYAIIGPNGHLGSSREIAFLTQREEMLTVALVRGAREPTFVWGTYNNEVWRATPTGVTRLSASKGPLSSDGFGAIADDRGRAIVVWVADNENKEEITWISLPRPGGRRIESVGEGSLPVLSRAGKQLFVNIDLGTAQRAIFTRRGSSWHRVNLGENRWSGRTLGASGPRAVFFWSHDNYNDEQVTSTDLYAWLYPCP